jgi:hypothetical protein
MKINVKKKERFNIFGNELKAVRKDVPSLHEMLRTRTRTYHFKGE